MKVKRSYVVLSLCFLFLASGLGLVVAVVSLSPSFGVGNPAAVVTSEDINISCANCTLNASGASTRTYVPRMTLFTLVVVTVGMSCAELF
jgi:hypothetical protein